MGCIFSALVDQPFLSTVVFFSLMPLTSVLTVLNFVRDILLRQKMFSLEQLKSEPLAVGQVVG